jgi:YidC/Oxa1 family membrane protein insertase
MQQENARNTIIFVVCTAVILIAYQALVLAPAAKRHKAELARQQATAAQVQAQAQGGLPGATAASRLLPREQALVTSARVPIDTPTLKGSISLTGARIDDLNLKQYRQAVDKNSPPVELFRPFGSQFAYFAQFGWLGRGGATYPDQGALWRPVSGSVLSVNKPVVLAFDTVEGLRFERTIQVDDKYMFTITDTVTNTSSTPQSLVPYGSVQRQGLPAEATANAYGVHEGAVGVFDNKLKLSNYKDWKKKGTPLNAQPTTGGWMGVTDKYWLAALAPDPHEPVKGSFRVTRNGDIDVYEASYVGATKTLAPGAKVTETTRLFAGAKKADILRGYEKGTPGIPRFGDAIDWGRLFFVTKPVFWVLEQFYKLFGGSAFNVGLSILALTVVSKLVLFPLANQAFASMSKMKKLQPKVDELKKKYADDQAKQQQEMMALYQREKINPLAGCLPILIQLPIFLALLKVLNVSIEMRHAPFFGWIRDLSARDPSSIWTLFGLIPWNPASAPLIGGLLDGMLHLPAWGLLYGGAMYLQQQMSPSSPDPTQQMIMKFFPLVFMFVLAGYPVGLLIYWTWSTLLTIAQQYFIMHRYGAENPIDDFIAKVRAPKAAG